LGDRVVSEVPAEPAWTTACVRQASNESRRSADADGLSFDPRSGTWAWGEPGEVSHEAFVNGHLIWHDSRGEVHDAGPANISDLAPADQVWSVSGVDSPPCVGDWVWLVDQGRHSRLGTRVAGQTVLYAGRLWWTRVSGGALEVSPTSRVVARVAGT